jgi:tripartite-type tricarboxylate transporter receptor subunit TctC
VVTNKTGGSGAIGTYAAMASPPDGYTILIISPTSVFAPLVRKGVTYNILKDFTVLNLSVTSPIVLLVKKEAPWQTLEELVAEAKKSR